MERVLAAGRLVTGTGFGPALGGVVQGAWVIDAPGVALQIAVAGESGRSPRRPGIPRPPFAQEPASRTGPPWGRLPVGTALEGGAIAGEVSAPPWTYSPSSQHFLHPLLADCCLRGPRRDAARAPIRRRIAAGTAGARSRDERELPRDHLAHVLRLARRGGCMAAVAKRRGVVAATPAVESIDGIAWDELLAVVHRQMRSLTGPSRDLEDLTQAALEQVVRSTPRFRGDSELTTFTYRVCVNVVMNHWRWWRRWTLRFEFGRSVGESEDTRPGPSHLALERERAECLHACLGRMAPTKRVVLTPCTTFKRCRRHLASPKSSAVPRRPVRSRLRKARHELAELLRREPVFATTEGDES